MPTARELHNAQVIFDDHDTLVMDVTREEMYTNWVNIRPYKLWTNAETLSEPAESVHDISLERCISALLNITMYVQTLMIKDGRYLIDIPVYPTDGNPGRSIFATRFGGMNHSMSSTALNSKSRSVD
jgi:hypothetical protein